MSSQQISMVDAAEALACFNRGKATIVDVREVEEYLVGHIPGAVLNPLSRFDPGKVPVEPGRALIFHCQAGIRCGVAAARMVESGFKGRINRLQGGFQAWTRAGGPATTGA
jgi:rhodanese-related sulfurtransferase